MSFIQKLHETLEQDRIDKLSITEKEVKRIRESTDKDDLTVIQIAEILHALSEVGNPSLSKRNAAFQYRIFQDARRRLEDYKIVKQIVEITNDRNR